MFYRVYPNIYMDFVRHQGTFGPELTNELSQKRSIPKKNMFIGSPGSKFPCQISELGGVLHLI